jgi:uncharacterized small protein (DUF1192 family)
MDDTAFEKAVAAAVVDDELAVAKVAEVPLKEAFDRVHVEQLRAAGCTKADARSYFEHVFGDARIRPPGGGTLVLVVDRLVDDLDSYGEWSSE